MLSQQIAVLSKGPPLLFSCGHRDNSIQVMDMSVGKIVQSVVKHRDVVTCLCLSEYEGEVKLVSGSRDCTVIVWRVKHGGAAASLGARRGGIDVEPIWTLYGHDLPVNCISCVGSSDVVVSASEDGTVIVHTLNSGTYTRTISQAQTGLARRGDPLSAVGVTISNGVSSRAGSLVDDSTVVSESGGTPTDQVGISWVGVSSCGYIVTYSKSTKELRTYSINGELQHIRIERGGTLNAFAWSEDGEVLITGGESRVVRFLFARDLQVMDRLPNTAGTGVEKGAVLDGSTNDPDHPCPKFDSEITSLYLNPSEKVLFVGLKSGRLYSVMHDGSYLRQRMHNTLKTLGFI
jgi:WD40 repeat protein